MFKKVFSLITGFTKFQIFNIIFLILIGAIFEILSIGVIIPLISFFSENSGTNYLSELLSLISSEKPSFKEQLKILMLLIFGVFFLRLIFLWFLTTKINLFIFTCQKNISNKLLKIFFKKNYEWHANNNKSNFINLMTTEVYNFCSNGLAGFLFLTAELIFFLGIVLFLLFWEPKLFIIVILIASIFFPVLIIFTRKITYKLGSSRQKMEREILKSINENLNGIKEMILYNWSNPVKIKFNILASQLAKITATHHSFMDIGRYLIEFFGILLVIMFIYFLTYASDNQSNLITLGVFGASLFRLMPILNRISTYSQRLKFGMASIDKLNQFIDNKQKNIELKKQCNFKKELKLENISFSYDKQQILDNVNLTIKLNEVVGIYGESGSGKTTLSNIIMGLLPPTNGKIIVDGKNINSENLSISNEIAFVPQNFFYLDANLADNITFFDKKINLYNLKFALKNSLLTKSILNKSLSLKTNLGNNALKISGGQLQRINIARALYRGPKILVLDEPTSSLDEENQLLFNKIINNLKKRFCIIIITHNQNLLNNSDSIYLIKNKKLFKEN